MSTIHCALNCKLCAKYSAHPPDYAMWTVVPDICNVATSAHIQSSVFNWTYLRRYWRHLENSMCLILQTWYHIQSTSSTLHYLNCGAGHIHWKYSSAYSDFNIQLNLPVLLLEVSRQFNERYTVNWVPNIAHTNQFTLCELWSRTYTM
jgi:hypothetical protein